MGSVPMAVFLNGGVTPEGFTPCSCAKTVPELHLFKLPGLPFERKQIPRFVVNIRIRRKTMEPLEATRLPWAQPRSRKVIVGTTTLPSSLSQKGLNPRTHRA